MSDQRCGWCLGDPLYEAYHDEEWGVPLKDDDRSLYEFLLLETFQAGLSWITVLRKREFFRLAFDNFVPEIVAGYSDQKLEELRSDPGIIRNRLKIEAARSNARAFLELQKEFGSFSNYYWAFTDHKPIQNHWEKLADVPAYTDLAKSLSKDLKKRGFRFVGPTVVYAFMQATGMVNDHLVSCPRHAEVLSMS